MTYSRDWSETAPLDHSKFKDVPESVRNVRTDLAERLADIVYGMTAGEGLQGGLKRARLITVGTGNASQPTGTGTGASIDLFGKTIGSVVDLFAIDTAGNVIQITSGGSLYAVRLTGDQSVAGVKTMASHIVAPDTAPSTALQYAPKGYVDNQFIATPTASKALVLDGDVAIPASADILKNVVSLQQANGTTDINCGSATLIDMTGMTLSVVVATGDQVYLHFSANILNSGGYTDLQLMRDSTVLQKTKSYNAAGNYESEATMVYVDTPAAGTYTYKVQWKYASADATNNCSSDFFHRTLIAIKLKA